jgi:hypothetical protein
LKPVKPVNRRQILPVARNEWSRNAGFRVQRVNIRFTIRVGVRVSIRVYILSGIKASSRPD